MSGRHLKVSNGSISCNHFLESFLYNHNLTFKYFHFVFLTEKAILSSLVCILFFFICSHCMAGAVCLMLSLPGIIAFVQFFAKVFSLAPPPLKMKLSPFRSTQWFIQKDLFKHTRIETWIINPDGTHKVKEVHKYKDQSFLLAMLKTLPKSEPNENSFISFSLVTRSNSIFYPGENLSTIRYANIMPVFCQKMANSVRFCPNLSQEYHL